MEAGERCGELPFRLLVRPIPPTRFLDQRGSDGELLRKGFIRLQVLLPFGLCLGVDGEKFGQMPRSRPAVLKRRADSQCLLPLSEVAPCPFARILRPAPDT